MKVFLSYCFDDRNKWIENLIAPLITALGFEVVDGRRMEGEELNDEIDARLEQCSMCVAFTTRRYPDNPRPDGSFETHPWVINEMTTARARGLKTIEVREDKVKIGDSNETIVRLRLSDGARDKLMAELAARLAELKKKVVKVQLVPPTRGKKIFRTQALRGEMTCKYEIESKGRIVSRGQTKIDAIKAGYFVDIEVPAGDFIVKLEVKKRPNGAWVSLGDGLLAIPIDLYDA